VLQEVVRAVKIQDITLSRGKNHNVSAAWRTSTPHNIGVDLAALQGFLV
jgi:hypothetical protein